MKSNFDLEQIRLLTEVEDIRNKELGTKRTGHEVCIVIKKHIQPHLAADYKVVGPNVYVDDISTEFDLLVVRPEAEPRRAAYESSQVQVVLEIKTAGIRANRQKYPFEIGKIRKKFDRVRMENTKIWGALVMCYGTIHPKKETSINYEEIRRRGLEPYNYGVYTLAERDEPQWGKWETFIRDLLCRLN